MRLQSAKLRLAVPLEDLRHRQPAVFFNLLIEVDEPVADLPSQMRANGAFSGPHESHKKHATASLLPHGLRISRESRRIQRSGHVSSASWQSEPCSLQVTGDRPGHSRMMQTESIQLQSSGVTGRSRQSLPWHTDTGQAATCPG